MKIHWLTVLTVLIVFGCMRDPYIGPSIRSNDVPDGQRELFVINGLAETVSVIDPETRDVYHDVLTTGMWPNHMIYYDGRLYVVNAGDNEIVVYDENTFEEDGKIYLGAGSNPWMIIRAAGTAKGYVTNFAAGEVAVVNLDTYTVITRIPVGDGPEGSAYKNGKVYVCNTSWDYQLFDYNPGTVSVIDTGTDMVIKTITVGKNPQSVFACPDIDEVHVICTGKNGGADSDDGEIYIIDTTANSLDDQVIAIGGSPNWTDGAFQQSNGTVFLSGVGGLMSYNYRAREILHGSDDYILSDADVQGDLYSGAVVDEVNGVLYSCFFTRDTIVVLDLDTYDVLETIEGSDGAQSIYLFQE